jgi:predicted RNA polymerase sigma factor
MSMCCHPSLSTSSAIALTLRAVGGLTTAEIAHAFLVPESTMAQRISRAKQAIRESGVPFAVADNHAAILHVLYLIFNEGYAVSAGESLQRSDLANEAIRLTRLVHAQLPEPEVAGLLALMLLTDARRAARTGPLGEPIPLGQQNRALWDQAEIVEGVALISAALKGGTPGPYQLQAAIAAVHDEAATFAATDWPQIVALYELLLSMSDNPVVALNYAVAVAMVHGPTRGLALLDKLNLTQNHRWHAARAHLLELAGDLPAALVSYQTAAAQTASQPERVYLLTQAARLRER